MIGQLEGNWKQMLADLDNLRTDHLSLGSETTFAAKYQSLRSEDRHFVAAYERFAERLVNTLDQVTRDLRDQIDAGNVQSRDSEPQARGGRSNGSNAAIGDGSVDPA